MKRDHGPPAKGPASLNTTYWTVVLKAAQSQKFGASAALAELFRLYWYPYEEAAKALGVSLSAAKSMIHRLRKRCASILREEVARTVSDPDEIDAEIHALCTALIASGGSLEP